MKIEDPPPVIHPTERSFFTRTLHMGVNYEPYHYDGQHPGVPIPVSQLQADITLISQTFSFFRTFTVEDNMDQVIPIAAGLNLQVAV